MVSVLLLFDLSSPVKLLFNAALTHFDFFASGYDCGVFTCMFSDFISNDCPLVFDQNHINQCRERIALSIMKGCAIE